MLRRFASLLVGVSLLGCTPSASAPAPSTPAEGGNAASPAAADTSAVQPEAGDPTSDAAATEPEPSAVAIAGAKAPVEVDTNINAEYDAQQSPKRWAARFEREGREVHDQRDAILAALGLREGMDVADVGAGTGLFTLALAEAVGPKGTVYAVDVQAYFLDHIGQKAREAELRNVELVRATQASAKLAEGTVDLVFMCDSYHHVEQPAAYLQSLHRALRPGGRLVVVDYIAIEGQSEAWMLEHVRATPAEFRAEIESAGFRFVRAHEGVLEENFFFELERP